MAKTKTLNGLSYSLAHSYFSTINYYSKGYMSDWIVNSAFDIGIDNVQIDIINKEIFPKELMIRPLLINLDYLKHIIDKTLKSNGLPVDFIKEAKFDIKVTKTDRLFAQILRLAKMAGFISQRIILNNHMKNFLRLILPSDK